MKKLILIFTIIVLYGCAATTKMTILSPAEDISLADYKNVVIWDVSGEEIGNYTPKFEKFFSQVTFNDKPVLNIKTGRAVSDMREKLILSPDDYKRVRKAADELEVQGIWFGKLTEDFSEEKYKKSIDTCGDNKPGGPDDHCGMTLTYCVRRSIKVSADMRLIDGATGDEAYKGVLVGKSSNDKCDDVGENLSQSVMRESAVNDIMISLRNIITPHEETVDVGLVTSKDGIMDDTTRNLFERGISFAKEQRMDKACEAWEKAYNRAPQAIGIMYSKSLCLERSGDYEGAIALLKELDTILPPASFMEKFNKSLGTSELPNTLVINAIDRNKKHIKERAKLKEQLNKM